MTRETKIGLLVGLAFIIVIGILLSDHFRSTMEQPSAELSRTGAMVNDAVVAPGTGNPPIVVVPPSDAPPAQRVPTSAELNPQPLPVVPSVAERQTPAIPPPAAASEVPTTPREPVTIDPQPQRLTPQQPAANDPLNGVAQQHGEQVVPANPDGTPSQDDSTTQTAKAYTAQAGDTLSRMAARLLGANTRANRQAIINANPSLKDDPDTIIAGQTYNIPARVSVQSPAPAPTTDATGNTPTAAAGEVYTVQAGDSLWRIANDELGDPSAVAAIEALNRNVLRGPEHDVVTVGMKLRLPAKTVSSTN